MTGIYCRNTAMNMEHARAVLRWFQRRICITERRNTAGDLFFVPNANDGEQGVVRVAGNGCLMSVRNAGNGSTECVRSARRRHSDPVPSASNM